MLHGQIRIGQRLGFNALRGVHNEDGTLARRQRTGYLVVKVHVTGGVDQVKDIGLPILGIVGYGDRVGLDGDAPLPFQIHAVQQLILHVAQSNRTGLFQNTVRQGGLTVVNMGDDTKITGVFAACRHGGPPFSSGKGCAVGANGLARFVQRDIDNIGMGVFFNVAHAETVVR